MQIELGMTSVTGFFGALTSQKCDEAPLTIGSTGNRVKLLQYGFYCKGYNPYSTNGTFTESTKNALIQIQKDAGLDDTMLSQEAKGLQLQAVLGVDEYKLVAKGDTVIRAMQQQLNRSYLDYTGLRPCDGIYSRGTNAALIYAIQAEEKIPASSSSGTFGPATTRCCPYIPYQGNQRDYKGNAYGDRSISSFILLFKYCLYCYGYNPGEFNSMINDQTLQALHTFQEDHKLEVRDSIQLNEWMGVLVSSGNPNRTVQGCDCASRITPEIAQKLKDAGYYVVGRYLTGDVVVGSGKRMSKNLLRPEMKAIFDAGLRLFVIYQDARQFFLENPSEETIFNYFDAEQGYADAEKAFSAAKSLGVPRNEIIYFAVDYDFMEGQVNSRIKPYFEAINNYARQAGNPYKIGIYSARNTCTIIRNAGYSVSSFVSGMSTGFSGNMGYRLPDDWAFDQIKEMGESASGIGIALDNNVISGKYYGFNSFEQTHDDEWDLISRNGKAYCLTSEPAPKREIPIYWAKVKNADGSYSAKYPTYSSLTKDCFYSERKQNTARPDASKDRIAYIYYCDSNGTLNAGYVNRNDLDEFQPKKFTDVQVFIDSTGYAFTNVTHYPDDYEYPIKFITTRQLTVYRQLYDLGNMITSFTLGAGTTVYLQVKSETGASYPTAIQAVEYENAEGDRLLFVENGVAYLDLGLEYGVLPKNRSLITAYNFPA